MLRHVSILAVAILALLLSYNDSLAKPTPSLKEKLQRRVTVTWQGQELATAVKRLADTAQIPIWLDRRVDRQQTVTLELDDLPLYQALEKLAQKQSLATVQLGNLLYIGPKQTARQLPNLIRQAHKSLESLPTQTRRRWLKPKATSWPRLSEPRTLADNWLREERLTLLDSQPIAHDLWPANSLPPSPLIDRLLLLLAGFDLTCQITPDGKSCQIVPLKPTFEVVPNDPLPPTKPKPTRTSRPSHQRFTLRLENQPLGPVLEQLARQLNLKIVWDQKIANRESHRQQHISCDIKNAKLNELLQSILAPAGLEHQRKDKQITIQEKPPQ